MTVAALYVDVEAGPYPGLLGRDLCWGVERDAKTYPGPSRVVAHPPCGPWGAFSWNCHKQDPEAALVAVEQVRRFGGVLEHPAGSKLWEACGLPTPFHTLPAIVGREWSLRVEQVRWGHPCMKRTWLFFVGVPPGALPDIPPPREATHAIGGLSRARKAARDAAGLPALRPQFSGGSRPVAHITPPAFAEWLVKAVRG